MTSPEGGHSVARNVNPMQNSKGLNTGDGKPHFYIENKTTFFLSLNPFNQKLRKHDNVVGSVGFEKTLYLP
jgi:hypothetical protein